MRRRTFIRLSSVSVAAGPLLPLAYPDDEHGKHGRGRQGDDGDDDKHRGRERRYFRAEDAAWLRQYYGGPTALPPGLRKKYYRTGKLPPGWEKRFRPFPAAVIQRLPPPPPNCDRGYVDGFAIVYDRRTRVILDVLDIINVAGGR